MWTMAAGLSTIVAGYWWPLGEESSGAQGRRVRSIIGNAVGADRAHDDFHIDDAERPGPAGRLPVVGRSAGRRGVAALPPRGGRSRVVVSVAAGAGGALQRSRGGEAAPPSALPDGRRGVRRRPGG